MDTIKKSIEIYDAKISFVSLVDRPANRRAFLLTKSEDNPGMMSFSGTGRLLEKATSEVGYLNPDGYGTTVEHYVTGVAYEPNVADTDDNFMTEGEIEKMAHWFMKNGRMVDEQHSFDPDPACHIVESWIAPQDLTINDQPVSKGTWLVKVEVDSLDVWNKIETGDITGFSIGGLAKYGTEDVNLDSNTPSGEEGGDATVVGENNPEIKSEEKRGLWIRLAKALGLTDEAECIEKGAVMDMYSERTKADGFWNAYNALENALTPVNWHGGYDGRYTSDPEIIRDALADFCTIITNLLTAEPTEIANAISADAQQEVAKGNKSVLKAGRKISAARMDQLKIIQEAVNNLVTDLDDPVEEEGEESGEEKPAAEEGEGESQSDTGASTNKAQKEEENPMTNEEMNTFAEMVAKAVAKEVATAQQQTTPAPAQKEQQPEDGATLTKADVEKMITEAVQKAAQATEEEPAANGEEPISKADVQAMIEKAVNEVKAARGLPTNLNDEGDGIQKGEAHDPKSPGFWGNLL